MKPRNQRIKTDYSQNNNKPPVFMSKLRDNRSNLRKRVSSLGNQQVFISRILQSISHDQDYENLNQLQLLKQRETLKIKVKQMKEALNMLLERQSQKKNEEERVNNKAIISKQMCLDLDSLNKQSINNRKTIIALQSELHANNQKLAALSDANQKLGRAKDAVEAQQKLKEMKKLMSRMKKNKFLRERQIIQGKGKQVDNFQHLQQEYITATKKQQFLQQKMHIIQQEIADIDYSLKQQKQYYNQLKSQVQIFEYDSPSTQKKQLLDAYTNKKRKLQLNWKRFQREEESQKKKYYELLLNFQKHQQKMQDINNKIFIAQKDIQALHNNMQIKLKKIKINNSPIRHTRINTQSIQTCQLELNSISKKENMLDQSLIHQSHHSRLQLQNKFNQINASHRKVARKWNILQSRHSVMLQNLNSIEHQSKLNQDPINYKFRQQRNLSFCKQVLNVRNQNTSKLDNEPLDQSDITFVEEEICQQFDSL